MTPTRKRGRPKNPPIDRSRYASMTIRRFPVGLLERIQARVVALNRRQREQRMGTISQEDFVVKLLEWAETKAGSEMFEKENPRTKES